MRVVYYFAAFVVYSAEPNSLFSAFTPLYLLHVSPLILKLVNTLYFNSR